MKEVLTGFIEHPIQLYSLEIISANDHFLIEINLDNLQDPRGSVSITDCEKVSRRLMDFLETAHGQENYTIQVSSAGAERELRLPDDLGRFLNVPVKIFYLENGKKVNNTFQILEFDGNRVILEPLNHKSKRLLGDRVSLDKNDILKGNLYIKF
ncbi:MAG: ribosome maturation factor RimP [Leptospiraceae bacterium]|nr:ribosome maturation factor RimP [Leptospiraceae bacterium]